MGPLSQAGIRLSRFSIGCLQPFLQGPPLAAAARTGAEPAFALKNQPSQATSR